MASNILALPLTTLSFVVSNNEDWIDALLYAVANNPNLPAPPVGTPPVQLDLRGINFQMELRRSPPEHEVILEASTAERTLYVGSPPNYGFLIWVIPVETLKYIEAGDYVGDVIANDGDFLRRVLDLTVTIQEGITR
jgi:hypothetical protein